MSDKWIELLPKRKYMNSRCPENVCEAVSYNNCLKDVIAALKGKVILVEELPSVEEIKTFLGGGGKAGIVGQVDWDIVAKSIRALIEKKADVLG